MTFCVSIKKSWLTTIYCSLVLQLASFAQSQKYTCGNDLLSTNFPSLGNPPARARLAAALDDTTTYTVPVVFLVYHLGEPVGSGSNISDANIQYQLDLVNQRYAGKGVNNYVGQDSKIRFKLANRTPLCNPTTGIIRIDGRSVPGYEANGITFDYTMHQQLAALAPDFKDQSVSSGLVVINVGHKVASGAYAYYGGAVYITAATDNDLNPYNYVLPHEVGHVLNLIHTYEGSALTSTGVYSCPGNTYNDQVEDTQPTRYFDPPNACDPGAEQFINPCTGLAFGTQIRNIMSYGCNMDRFTPGQIARMRYYLASDHKELANSGLDRPLSPSEVMAPLTCTVNFTQPPPDYNRGHGINRFQFNTIDHNSCACIGGQYNDYSCLNGTQATLGQSYRMTIDGFGTFGRAYIDYNNDGAFDEATELVMSFETTDNFPSPSSDSQLITIPKTAVVNQKLRMRIVFDHGNTPPTACNLPGAPGQGSGEVEDYGISLVTVSCHTVRSGNWNDPSTWSCGQVPAELNDVVIEAAHSVVLDSTMPEATCRNLELLGTFSMQGSSIVVNGNRIVIDQDTVLTR